MEPTEEMKHYAALVVDKWLGTIPSWPPDPRANHLVTLRKLVAERLASVAEQAKREGRTEVIGFVQRWQPAGSPPPTDWQGLIRWIMESIRAEGYEEAARIADDALRACITHEEREVVTTVRNLILSRAMKPGRRG